MSNVEQLFDNADDEEWTPRDEALVAKIKGMQTGGRKPPTPWLLQMPVGTRFVCKVDIKNHVWMDEYKIVDIRGTVAVQLVSIRDWDTVWCDPVNFSATHVKMFEVAEDNSGPPWEDPQPSDAPKKLPPPDDTEDLSV